MNSDPADTSAEEGIAVDCICVECGYNLRGLKEDGLCPECGKPVALSLGIHLLARSDRIWRQTVASGTSMLAFAMPMTLFLRTLTFYRYVRVLVSISWLRLSFPDPWQILFIGVFDVFNIVGVWRATTYEARPHGAPVVDVVRIRAVAIGGLISSLFTWTCLRPPGIELQGIVYLVSLAFAVMEVELFYRYLSRLAGRLPNPVLARQLAGFAPFYACSLIAANATYTVMRMGSLGSPRLRVLLALPGQAGVVASLTIAIFLLRAFTRAMRDTFRRDGDSMP